MSDIYVGLKAQNIDIGAEMPEITGIRLVVDSDHEYIVGDAAGRMMEVECPWGTEDMAKSILATMSDLQYRPYAAERAMVDPAFELGDSVMVGGIPSVIINSDINYNGAALANIDAPALDEIDDEYPARQIKASSFERQLAYTRSLISKTVDSITLSVTDEDGEVSIQLKAGDKELGSPGTIDLTGVVTFSALAGEPTGTTTINGGWIDADTLTVNAANITGTLTIGNLPSDVAKKEDIPTKVSDLTNDKSYQTKAQVTTITNNAISAAEISADQITTGTLYAENMYMDGLLELLCDDETAGWIGGTDYGGYSAVLSGSDQRTFVYARDTQAGLSYGMGKQYIYVKSSGCWCSEEMAVASDRRLKNNISYDLAAEEEMFMHLKPCTFRMNSDNAQKINWGFVAQEVIEGAQLAGLEPDKLAVLKNDDGMYGLAYGHFTALNTHMIQKLMARVTALEEAKA